MGYSIYKVILYTIYKCIGYVFPIKVHGTVLMTSIHSDIVSMIYALIGTTATTSAGGSTSDVNV